VRILLISGSTRAGSTNTAALRTAALVAPDGVTAELYEGLRDLPAFVPDDPGTPAVAELRARLAAADAVLFCTPEYAGTLPGSLKNLLDWTVGSGELNGKPTAWLAVAHPGRGEGALDTLRTVLAYVDADVVAPACVRVTVARDLVDADGIVTDESVRTGFRDTLRTLADHAAARNTTQNG
jgi:NAD(P)H-dependent FMN reductase